MLRPEWLCRPGDNKQNLQLLFRPLARHVLSVRTHIIRRYELPKSGFETLISRRATHTTLDVMRENFKLRRSTTFSRLKARLALDNPPALRGSQAAGSDGVRSGGLGTLNLRTEAVVKSCTSPAMRGFAHTISTARHSSCGQSTINGGSLAPYLKTGPPRTAPSDLRPRKAHRLGAFSASDLQRLKVRRGRSQLSDADSQRSRDEAALLRRDMMHRWEARMSALERSGAAGKMQDRMPDVESL